MDTKELNIEDCKDDGRGEIHGDHSQKEEKEMNALASEDGNESDCSDGEDTEEAEKTVALMTWLKTFPQCVDFNDSEQECVDLMESGDSNIARCVLLIAHEIYDNQNTDIRGNSKSLGEDIWNHLRDMTSTSSESHKTDILSTLLCRVVSDVCARRQDYISRIMNLPSHIQRTLMTIIEHGMNAPSDQAPQSPSPSATSNASSPASHCSTPVPSAQQQQSTNLFSPSLSSTASPQLHHIHMEQQIVQLQQQLQQLQNENNQLSEQLSQSTSSENTLSLELQDLQTKHRSEVLRLETSSLDQITDLKEQHNQEITALQKQIQHDIPQYQSKIEQYQDQISNMQDELDLLQHSQHKLSTTEDQYHKCKEKLQSLLDVERQLKQQQEAHSKSIEQCLAYETQLNALKHVKRQLEQCQTRAVDAEVRLTEVQDELHKSKRLADQYRQEVNELREGNQMMTRDMQLNLESNRNAAQNDEYEGIGDGITELNPELKKELLQLRNENQRLTEFEQKRQHDSVQKLEESLDDSQQLSNKFKEKFLTTKQTLEDTCKTLEQTKQSLKKTEDELKESEKREKNLEDKLSQETQHKEQYNQKYLETKSTLEATDKKLKDSVKREEQLKLDIQDRTQKHIMLEQSMKKERQNHQKSMLDAERKQQAEKRNLIDQARLDMQQLEQRHNKAMEKEKLEHKARLEQSAQKMKEREEQAQKELSVLREQTSNTIRTNRDSTQKLIEDKERDHKIKVEEMTQHFEKERGKMISKGKAMIQKQKEENAEKLKQLQEQHDKTVEKMKAAYMKFKQDHDAYESQARAKIAQYKHKLHVATGCQNSLNQELDELREMKQKLDRDRNNLQKDNERYRRQLGSRFGQDSGVQRQFEALQTEYEALVEEHRRLLKQQESQQQYQMNMTGYSSYINASGASNDGDGEDANMSTSYLGGGQGGSATTSGISNATLTQLRSEYEETIQKLQDEKREFVMRNSAAISDVQKAEQRSWELDEEVSRLKKELTSMKLALQREEMRQNQNRHFDKKEDSPPDETATSIDNSDENGGVASSSIDITRKRRALNPDSAATTANTKSAMELLQKRRTAAPKVSKKTNNYRGSVENVSDKENIEANKKLNSSDTAGRAIVHTFTKEPIKGMTSPSPSPFSSLDSRRLSKRISGSGEKRKREDNSPTKSLVELTSGTLNGGYQSIPEGGQPECQQS